MLEAMLFGYERGSFTGAVNAHAGKFEQARAERFSWMRSPRCRWRCRRSYYASCRREVERLGGSTPVSLDVRVIATTNLLRMSGGRPFAKIYYRLNVFPLALTPLRERRDDILPLATHLLQQRVVQGNAFRRSRPTLRICLTYNWPGNVRELDNLLQRAVVLTEHGHRANTSSSRCSHAQRRGWNSSPVLQRALQRAERDVILEALRAAR
jgi:two-component system response regulator FlrC